jgi:hypothetical protein
MTTYATSDIPQVRAYAQIANQAQPWIPLDMFDIELAAYGSIGHFTCTTAISGLAGFGWGPNNLLGAEIENSQPQLYDGSPTYPIKLYAVGAYDNTLSLIFAGDIDELTWEFDKDELTISGRDYGGRLHDWSAVLTPSWVNMAYSGFAALIINAVGLTPQIASAASINQSLANLLFQIGTSNIPGTQRLGYNKAAISDSYSMWSNPVNMWELLNEVARSVGFIVTVHNDATVYVGPPGGDSEVSLTPRIFTWFASASTPNVVPVRNITIDHGPRQYGTFAVRGFAFHAPSVSVSSTSVYAFSGNNASFTAAGIGRQAITAGVYKTAAASAGFAPGKPNYYFYFQGKTEPQIKAEALALTFDIAKYLYVVHGEIDGDTTLVPTTPLTLSEAVPGYLQGYAAKQLNISGVNHTFNMTDGFLTKFTAWYAPSPQSLPTEPGESAAAVTS